MQLVYGYSGITLTDNDGEPIEHWPYPQGPAGPEPLPEIRAKAEQLLDVFISGDTNASE